MSPTCVFCGYMLNPSHKSIAQYIRWIFPMPHFVTMVYLWDMGLLHCGICAMGLFKNTTGNSTNVLYNWKLNHTHFVQKSFLLRCPCLNPELIDPWKIWLCYWIIIFKHKFIIHALSIANEIALGLIANSVWYDWSLVKIVSGNGLLFSGNMPLS